MKNKPNFNNFRNIIITALIMAILIMLLIFFLDQNPCHTEEYSLKWLQSVQLLLVSFFAYKNFEFNKRKIKTFWILVCLAFLFAAIDELVRVHERIGDMLNNTIIDKFYPYPLDSFVLIVYSFIALVFLLYYFKPFYMRYKQNKWLYLLVLALVIHTYSVFADVVSFSCSEEYAEAFASLFYFLAFLFAYKNHDNEETSQSKIIIKNKKYLVITGVIFILFIAVLLYSYIFKLGYLWIALKLFFFLTPILLLINIFRKNNNTQSRIFWTTIFFVFVYVLLDKYFRLHSILSRYLTGFNMDPVILINIIYVITFIVVVSFFYKYLLSQYKENPVWIYLFIFAILLKIIAIFLDYAFHDITEDYFELFSLYFFFSIVYNF